MGIFLLLLSYFCWCYSQKGLSKGLDLVGQKANFLEGVVIEGRILACPPPPQAEFGWTKREAGNVLYTISISISILLGFVRRIRIEFLNCCSGKYHLSVYVKQISKSGDHLEIKNLLHPHRAKKMLKNLELNIFKRLLPRNHFEKPILFNIRSP